MANSRYHRCRISALGVVLTAGLLAPVAVQAQTNYRDYTIELFDAGNDTFPETISNNGKVSGRTYAQFPVFQAFVYDISKHTYTLPTYNYPGDLYIWVYHTAINASDSLLVYAYTGKYGLSAFLNGQSTSTPIDPIKDAAGNVIAGFGYETPINDKQQIAGFGAYCSKAPTKSCTTNDYVPVVYIYNLVTKALIRLPAPSGILDGYWTIEGLNNIGQFVGSHTDANKITHAFIYTASGYSTFDYPGANSTGFIAINDRGTIVGSRYVGSDRGYFIYDLTTNTYQDITKLDLGVPNIATNGLAQQKPPYLTGINNSGQITGSIVGWQPGIYANVAGFVSSPGKNGDNALARAKKLGDCGCNAAGNPINSATGNKFQVETDYVGGPATGLEFSRYYNSLDKTPLNAPLVSLGKNWRTTYDRAVSQPASNTALVSRPDGRVDSFTRVYDQTLKAYVWRPAADVTRQLSAVLDTSNQQTGWKVVDEDDTSEIFDLNGKLTAIVSRSGLTTTVTYDNATWPSAVTVTGPFGHTLTYNNTSLQTPDGTFYYDHDAIGNLTSVSYPGLGTGVRRYLYENTAFPNALTGITDENANRFASYTYDAQGRAIASQHAGGAEKTAVAYNADGTSTVTEANGSKHAYTFRNQFDLLKPAALTGTPYPAVGAKAFAYDVNGFVARKTDYDGNITTYIHNARGLETSRTEAFGTSQARTITTTWHPTFHLPVRINEPGRSTSFVYDAKGNLRTKTVTAGALTRTWSYTYSTLGQLLSINGPRTDLADVTRFTYDAKGNLATMTDALGHITRFTSYDASGRLLSMQDPNGGITSNTYNTRGWLTIHSVNGETTRYALDPAGQLTKLTNPDGSYFTYSYDAAHRLTGVSDTAGNTITYTRDASGNVTKEVVKDAYGIVYRSRSHSYDAVNRLIKDMGTAGQLTSYSYDANGNLTGVSDALGHATANAFDALNRLVKTTDAGGGVTAYGYDANDRVISVSDPKGLATAYSFDGLDDRTGVASPDTGTTADAYDAAGNLVSSTDARGITVSYSYDALNRRTGLTASDGTTVKYTYDQNAAGIGHLTGMTDPSGTTAWGYRSDGRVVFRQQQTGAVTLSTGYDYDVAGRLTSMTYPSGKTLTYLYDAQGHIQTILADGKTVLSRAWYDPFGPNAGWLVAGAADYQTGFNYNRPHDTDGNITTVYWGIGYNTARWNDLTYDVANRITTVETTNLPAATFTYDSLDRLTGFVCGTASQKFGYDADTNRTSLVANGVTTSYLYPVNSNRLTSRTEAAATTSYTYDAAGNLTSDGSRSFVYDGRGRLVKVTVGAAVTQYAINGLGQRVAKAGATVPTGRNIYVYDEAGHLIGEYDNTGKLRAEYVWLGDLPVAVITPAATYYVMPDHLGAPWTIADATGKVVWTWNRDPFGTTQPTGSITYNLRFPGQYYDKETGLHYNYYRDYDPKLGRYIQSDPIGLAGGVNTYAYVGGDPVNTADSQGLLSVSRLLYQLNKLLEIGYKKGIANVKDCARDKLAEALLTGSLYANGGYVLPKELRDIVDTMVTSSILGIGRFGGIITFFQTLAPTELNAGEQDWINSVNWNYANAQLRKTYDAEKSRRFLTGNGDAE